MTRKSWVQDPVTLELIPKDEYQPRQPAGFFVMGDIQPYRSMITGEQITGRRQHREHLRQHGCIEVGNERITPKTPTPLSREDRRRDLFQSMSGLGL